jgi:tripartite-type tricarboxylate transporter receptor subunit TctC
MHANTRVFVPLALALATAGAAAQTYPFKTVRLVIPFATGGTTDLLARTLGQKLTAATGQQFIIDNRPGAGGTIGSDLVAKSPADGYTLVFGSTSSIVVAPNLYRNLPYDQLRDFIAVTEVAAGPIVLAVHPSLPAQNVRELIALAKARPGMLNFGSSGNGTSLHLAGEYLKFLAKIDMTHVPYKGIGQALPDLVAGQLQLMFSDMAPFDPFVKAGKLRVIAVTTGKRSALYPNLPSIAESGVAGFDLAGWYGLLAPAGTPRPVIDRLNAEFRQAIHAPDMKERYVTFGLEPVGSSPEQFDAFMRAELTKWGDIVRRSGTKLE